MSEDKIITEFFANRETNALKNETRLDPDSMPFAIPDFGFNNELSFNDLYYSNMASEGMAFEGFIGWKKFMDCVSMYPRYERVQNYIQFVNEKKLEGLFTGHLGQTLLGAARFGSQSAMRGGSQHQMPPTPGLKGGSSTDPHSQTRTRLEFLRQQQLIHRFKQGKNSKKQDALKQHLTKSERRMADLRAGVADAKNIIKQEHSFMSYLKRKQD